MDSLYDQLQSKEISIQEASFQRPIQNCKSSKVIGRKINSCHTLKLNSNSKPKPRIIVMSKPAKHKASESGKHESVNHSPVRSSSKKIKQLEKPSSSHFSSPISTLVFGKEKSKKPLNTEKHKLAKGKKFIFDSTLQISTMKQELGKIHDEKPDSDFKRPKTQKYEKVRRKSIQGLRSSELSGTGKILSSEQRNLKEKIESRQSEDEDHCKNDLEFSRKFSKAKEILKALKSADKKIGHEKPDKPKKGKDPAIQNYIKQKKKKLIIEKNTKRIEEDLKEKERIHGLQQLEQRRKVAKLKKKPKSKIVLEKEKEKPKSLRKKKSKKSSDIKVKPSHFLQSSILNSSAALQKFKEINAAIKIQRWFRSRHYHLKALKNPLASFSRSFLQSSSAVESEDSEELRTHRDEWVNILDAKLMSRKNSEFVEEFKAKMQFSSVFEIKPHLNTKESETEENIKSNKIESAESSSSEEICERPSSISQTPQVKKKNPAIPPLSLELLKNMEMESDDMSDSEKIDNYDETSEYEEENEIPAGFNETSESKDYLATESDTNTQWIIEVKSGKERKSFEETQSAKKIMEENQKITKANTKIVEESGNEIKKKEDNKTGKKDCQGFEEWKKEREVESLKKEEESKKLREGHGKKLEIKVAESEEEAEEIEMYEDYEESDEDNSEYWDFSQEDVKVSEENAVELNKFLKTVKGNAVTETQIKKIIAGSSSSSERDENFNEKLEIVNKKPLTRSKDLEKVTEGKPNLAKAEEIPKVLQMNLEIPEKKSLEQKVASKETIDSSYKPQKLLENFCPIRPELTETAIKPEVSQPSFQEPKISFKNSLPDTQSQPKIFPEKPNNLLDLSSKPTQILHNNTKTLEPLKKITDQFMKKDEKPCEILLKKDQELAQSSKKDQEFTQALKKAQEFSQTLKIEQELPQPFKKEQEIPQPFKKEQEFPQPLKKEQGFTQPLQKDQEFPGSLKNEQEFPGPLKKGQEFTQALKKNQESTNPLKKEQEYPQKSVEISENPGISIKPSDLLKKVSEPLPSVKDAVHIPHDPSKLQEHYPSIPQELHKKLELSSKTHEIPGKFPETFPKHLEIPQKPLEVAQRPDLVSKPIEDLIKSSEMSSKISLNSQDPHKRLEGPIKIQIDSLGKSAPVKPVAPLLRTLEPFNASEPVPQPIKPQLPMSQIMQNPIKPFEESKDSHNSYETLQKPLPNPVNLLARIENNEEVKEKDKKSQDSQKKASEKPQTNKKILENYPKQSPKQSPRPSPRMSPRIGPSFSPRLETDYLKQMKPMEGSEITQNSSKKLQSVVKMPGVIEEAVDKNQERLGKHKDPCNPTLKASENPECSPRPLEKLYEKPAPKDPKPLFPKNFDSFLESNKFIEKILDKTPDFTEKPEKLPVCPQFPSFSTAPSEQSLSKPTNHQDPFTFPPKSAESLDSPCELFINESSESSEKTEKSSENLDFISLIRKNSSPLSPSENPEPSIFSNLSLNIDIDEMVPELIINEVNLFLRIIPFKDLDREVDGSIEYILEYLESMAKELKENEVEVLDAINTPVYQEPLSRLAMLQDTASDVLSKFPTLELILPPELCSELKVQFQSLEIPSRQIYLQMLFDCVNEALNYIRPFGVSGIPDPWSVNPRILFGEAELENVFTRIITYLMKWSSCKAGCYHSQETQNDEERLQCAREERMSNLLCMDVRDEEMVWLQYEEEETQTKLLVSFNIFDLLVEEVIGVVSVI